MPRNQREFEFFSQRAKILIVDDEQDTRDIFTRHLMDEYEIDQAESAQQALQKLSRNEYHIAMTDLVMPGEDGLELLRTVKAKWPHVAVIVISGKASIEMAVEAMKSGAEDFIEKPVEDLELIKLVIHKILKIRWQAEEIKRLRTILEKEFDASTIVGNSFAIQQILEKVRKIAPLDTTVLLTGETGVGKEMFADLVYRNSKRKTKKFVAVNCGGLPENLLESLLFGHRKGAFTGAVRDKVGYFQEADGGTLFLDEITETTPAFQIKLLRVLEKGVIRAIGGDRDIEVNVRILAASNKNLMEEVEKGTFREDLYYRLNVINIHIPPLRERVEDIKLLAHAFVQDFARKHDKPNLTISQAAMSLLQTREWKGNVRELKNAIEHAVALSVHNTILPDDLPAHIYKSTSHSYIFNDNLLNLPFATAKESFEKSYIEELLRTTSGDVSKAAQISQIKRQNLYEKFKKYQLDVDAYRGTEE
jgi:DNA-binding NtrC family response regulator